MGGAIEEDVFLRVPVHLFEAEEVVDGLVRAPDLLHPLDLKVGADLMKNLLICPGSGLQVNGLSLPDPSLGCLAIFPGLLL